MPVLTSVDEIRPLKREQAARGYPVKLRGVVTCVVQYQNGFVIQDATHGIYVVNSGTTNDLPQVGNLLGSRRQNRPGFVRADCVNARHFNFLGDGKFPAAGGAVVGSTDDRQPGRSMGGD